MGAQEGGSGFSAGPGGTQGNVVVAARDARPMTSPDDGVTGPQSTLNRAQEDGPPDPSGILFAGGRTAAQPPDEPPPKATAAGDTKADETFDTESSPRLALSLPTAKHEPQRASRAKWLQFQANKPLSKVLTGLSIVLGAFLLLAWAVRRRMPKGAARLPEEIIEVLGRTTLAAKQSLHLVRVGGKLIVVSVTAGGTKTLTEITDPTEVTRILAACQQRHAQSSTAAFRQVFEQLGREPAQGFIAPQAGRMPLGGNERRIA
jgi:flagellar biogenesis protein FliO